MDQINVNELMAQFKIKQTNKFENMFLINEIPDEMNNELNYIIKISAWLNEIQMQSILLKK